MTLKPIEPLAHHGTKFKIHDHELFTGFVIDHNLWVGKEPGLSAAGETFSTDAYEIPLMLGMRMTHPRRNNNYGYMEAGVIFVDYDQRFDDENQSWASDDTRDSGLAVQLGRTYRASALCQSFT